MLFIFLFYACGSGQGSSSDSTGTGSLGFKLIWQNRSDLRAAQQTDRSDVCADYLIATITADVYNASNAVVASQSWDCDAPGHQGTISDVPTGIDMYVVVRGYVSGDADWEGRSETFSLSAGEEKIIEPVTLEYVGAELTFLKITDLKLFHTADDTSVTLDQGWKLIQDINGNESEGFINANLWRGNERSDYIWLAYKAELTDQPGLEEIHILSNDDTLNAELFGDQTHDEIYGVDAPGCQANATVNLNSNTCADGYNNKNRSSCCGNYFWDHKCDAENDLELYLHYVQQTPGSSPITCVVLGDHVAVDATQSLDDRKQHIHWGPADADRNGTVDDNDAVYVLENVQWLKKASDDTLVNLNWNTQSYRVWNWYSCDYGICSDGGWDDGWIHGYEAEEDAQFIGYCVE
ncbi:MAG: hypothetical protein PVG41_06360 [Desulfobacteraceae bacterium]|jgi:hypothetical protein